MGGRVVVGRSRSGEKNGRWFEEREVRKGGGVTGDSGTLSTILDFYSNLNKSAFKLGYTGRDGCILRKGNESVILILL